MLNAVDTGNPLAETGGYIFNCNLGANEYQAAKVEAFAKASTMNMASQQTSRTQLTSQQQGVNFFFNGGGTTSQQTSRTQLTTQFPDTQFPNSFGMNASQQPSNAQLAMQPPVGILMNPTVMGPPQPRLYQTMTQPPAGMLMNPTVMGPLQPRVSQIMTQPPAGISNPQQPSAMMTTQTQLAPQIPIRTEIVTQPPVSSLPGILHNPVVMNQTLQPSATQMTWVVDPPSRTLLTMQPPAPALIKPHTNLNIPR